MQFAKLCKLVVVLLGLVCNGFSGWCKLAINPLLHPQSFRKRMKMVVECFYCMLLIKSFFLFLSLQVTFGGSNGLPSAYDSLLADNLFAWKSTKRRFSHTSARKTYFPALSKPKCVWKSYQKCPVVIKDILSKRLAKFKQYPTNCIETRDILVC